MSGLRDKCLDDDSRICLCALEKKANEYRRARGVSNSIHEFVCVYCKTEGKNAD